MDYITTKRARINGLSGEVNLPFGIVVQCVDNMLHHNGRPLCLATSQNAYDYFARDDDGKGLERGKLIHAIQEALHKRDEEYQARWNKVWADPRCQKFKRADHKDYWLWNHEFFNAEIPDLRYIAALVGAKGV